MNWRPGDKNDPENCPVCGGNKNNCDHPTIRPAPAPKTATPGKEDTR